MLCCHLPQDNREILFSRLWSVDVTSDKTCMLWKLKPKSGFDTYNLQYKYINYFIVIIRNNVESFHCIGVLWNLHAQFWFFWFGTEISQPLDTTDAPWRVLLQGILMFYVRRHVWTKLLATKITNLFFKVNPKRSWNGPGKVIYNFQAQSNLIISCHFFRVMIRWIKKCKHGLKF